MNNKILLLIGISFFPLLAMQDDIPSTSQDTHQELLKINDIITNSSYCFNGVILIKEGNEEIFSVAQGIADKKNPEKKLSIDDQFICGSITKQMLACLVLRYAEQDLLDLNTPLAQYGIAREFDWSHIVTIHNLLNHSSGIVTPAQKKPLFIPGSDFKYSNYGYHLLGLVVKKIKGKCLENLFKKMFKKANLQNTGFYNDTDTPLAETFEDIVPGHMRLYGTNYWFCKENPYQAPWPLPYLYPAAGGVVTTADDLHIWNQALHNGLVVDKESLASLTTPTKFVKEHYLGEGFGYGYGLWISQNDELREHSHNGYVWGYMALNCYYPEHKTSLIILENVSEPLLADTMQARKYTFRSHAAIRDIVRSYLLQKGTS